MLPCIKENKAEAQKFLFFNLYELISKISNMSSSKNFWSHGSLFSNFNKNYYVILYIFIQYWFFAQSQTGKCVCRLTFLNFSALWHTEIMGINNQDKMNNE